MKRVVVTGGSGLLGQWVVREFVDAGYDVLNVDVSYPEEELCHTMIVDLTDLGQVVDVFAGAEAVAHVAAIPRVGIRSSQLTFGSNTLSTYNVLEACYLLGIRKTVITSSEASYGLVFPTAPIEPEYAPVDEDHPQRPQDAYGLSKVTNELTAEAFNRRCGMQVVSFRMGNVITPELYQSFPGFIHDPEQRKHIMWSYIDARDAATAYRLALEADGLGSVPMNIANDETSMDMTDGELMRTCYPNVADIRVPLDSYETLFSNKRAKRLLGWQPRHRWRDYV
jgi:nucleoside-diphosphate-sugar epimerase